MTRAPITLAVADGGTITGIYTDDLTDLAEQGSAEVRRASHVEPARGCADPTHQPPGCCPDLPRGGCAAIGWAADMSPVNGPALGPFRLRAEALDAERGWLERNVVLGGGA